MPKKKLLIVLGAGSSISHGMPSVGALGTDLLQWAQNWTGANPGCFNFYQYIWDNAQAYAALEPKPALRRWVSFEPALATLVKLMNWVRPAPVGSDFRRLVTGSPDSFPSGMDFSYLGRPSDPRRFSASSLVNFQLMHLLSKLAVHMRAHSRNLNSSTPHFTQYSALMTELRNNFDVGIYNLNYDNVAITSLPGFFTGFQPDGRFDASAVLNRTAWNFIYHLHGSVHHSLLSGSLDVEWRPNLGGTFDDGDIGRPNVDAADDVTLPRSTLIAGGAKLDQLQFEPYLSFYSTLIRHADAADAILLGGYGFADLHVNNVLRRRFLPPSRPPLMVLTKSSSSDDPIPFRNDAWTNSFCRTVHTDGDHFSQSGGTAPAVMSDLLASKGFEVSTRDPVAIWHGGFDAAAIRRHEIAAWLQDFSRSLP